jgi:ABC-type hemin transport system substrate-binding protein
MQAMKHPVTRTALAALALIGSLGNAHAEAKDQNALRALAVGGTLASWAYGLWEGAPSPIAAAPSGSCAATWPTTTS